MSTAGREALTNELRQARQANHGGILRGMLSYECTDERCPVGRFSIAFGEELGRTKPLQPPMMCPRCRAEARYIGLQRS